jgi:hypothetical protein
MILTKQQATFDCFLACITCAVQRPYAELWPADFLADIEAKQTCSGDNIDKAFTLAGLTEKVDYWSHYVAMIPAGSLRGLLKGRRALLQVPSLNNPPPAQHIVYWTGSELHDPSNKQVYRWIDQCQPQHVWLFNERTAP